MMRAVHNLLAKLRASRARKQDLSQAAKALSDKAHLPHRLRKQAVIDELSRSLGRETFKLRGVR